jgi:ferric-dicitrate binding protein FerR (iron transport regulator)
VVILLVASGVVYVWLEKKPENNLAKTQKPLPGNDVLPGGNKAVLTLADGSTIVLDNTAIGIVTQQGNTKVLKTNNGKLAYNTDRGKPVEVLYNTVSTPRGGQYQIELPDGSQVWLNAASSLRFPTAFIGKDRRVEITGEAYFEVTKNKSMPFIVSVEGSEIQVLGTHFNVMAYKEESNIKTTLLEGSIKFVHGNNSSLIKPGQQTQLANSGQIKVLDDIDMDAVIAWKNGNFDFNGVDIETVMRQLSRWYNVEVEYNKKTDVLFYAEIPRNTKLSEVLHALEYTSKVKFDINGKKIVVM